MEIEEKEGAAVRHTFFGWIIVVCWSTALGETKTKGQHRSMNAMYLLSRLLVCEFNVIDTMQLV